MPYLFRVLAIVILVLPSIDGRTYSTEVEG